MASKTYEGGCHCGAVRYQTELDLEAGSIRCNCSYCAKVRAWFTFAKGAESFRLTRGAPAEYRWTPPGRSHAFLTFAFCGNCGVRVFARGELESLGGVFHAISVPTIELTDAERVAIPIRYADGRNDDFGATPAETVAL